MLLYMCLLAGSLFGSNLQTQQDVNLDNPNKPTQTSFIDLPDEIKSQIFSYVDRKKLSLVSSHIASLKNENIKEIKISKMQGVTEKTLTDILNKLPRLQSIQFTGQDYNEDAFNTLISQVSHYKNITELSFEDRSWVTDDIIKNFNSLENIIYLNLNDCDKITDAGLGGLPPYLDRLDLAFCTRITDAGLEHLPTHLTFLNLMLCANITDGGIKRLSHKLNNLCFLNLCLCVNITNGALEQLPPYLTSLVLIGCNKITDAGLEHLYQLKYLQFAYVNKCNITEQGMQELKNKLPNLTIHQ